MRQAETKKEATSTASSLPPQSYSLTFSQDELRLFENFLRFLHQAQGAQGAPALKGVPLSAFNPKLSIQETIIKYLREDLRHSYNTIGKTLHRNPGPIGVTYRNAKRKMPGRLDLSSPDLLPLDIFSNKMTTFESVVFYLKETKGYPFKDIAKLLHRNYRTIWTEWNRAKGR